MSHHHVDSTLEEKLHLELLVPCNSNFLFPPSAIPSDHMIDHLALLSIPGLELRTSCMLGKLSATEFSPAELNPQPLISTSCLLAWEKLVVIGAAHPVLYTLQNLAGTNSKTLTFHSENYRSLEASQGSNPWDSPLPTLPAWVGPWRALPFPVEGSLCLPLFLRARWHHSNE